MYCKIFHLYDKKCCSELLNPAHNTYVLIGIVYPTNIHIVT